MIIGNGDLAKALNNRHDVIFFASGVSDSSCTDSKEFQREIELLYKQDREKCLVYFSSIDTGKESPYLKHKKIMERYVTALFQHCVVIRIGNITWGDNPKTFLNYLRNEIKSGRNPEIRDELKYMIEKKDLLFITDNLPTTGQHKINAFSFVDKVENII